ncbi:MAG: ribosome maturation factor RimP [Alphaproteobacteria bacterium]|nr:ribosome maturation factor RimP [Alphaproteobacteria bacterium]
MRLSPLEQRVSNAIAPVITDMGFTLVHVIMTSEDNSAILRVMAENPETKQLNIDDCAKLSRAVGTVLDVEDIISGAYRLELSSPGIDRPLVREADFVEHAGFKAKVDIDPPLANGQKRFRGEIKGIEDDNLLLESEEGPVALPLYNIQKARLIITDELLKAGQEKRRLLKEAEEQKLKEQQELEQNQQNQD